MLVPRRHAGTHGAWGARRQPDDSPGIPGCQTVRDLATDGAADVAAAAPDGHRRRLRGADMVSAAPTLQVATVAPVPQAAGRTRRLPTSPRPRRLLLVIALVPAPQVDSRSRRLRRPLSHAGRSSAQRATGCFSIEHQMSLTRPRAAPVGRIRSLEAISPHDLAAPAVGGWLADRPEPA